MAPIIVFGPLLASAFAGLFGNYVGHRAAQIVTTGAVLLSAILSWIVFFDVTVGGNTTTIHLATWMSVGDFDVSWAIKLDSLSAVMLVVVNSVSSLVHIYSWGYMSHDPHRARFFSYLSLFTFAMLALVTADNFLQLFFGWEGVGLASYLLIGFWYKKKSANDAAIKAFVTNRVGDFGFALGIMAIFLVFGSVAFDDVFAQVGDQADAVLSFAGMSFNAIELIAFLLFIGAMGKSAQFFLHVWLPDAMEGPTPVSALIHAATMVTAGVFLVCRAFPIYEMAPNASAIVTVIGAVTALFAATVGMAQNDIKRVVAYSTCSQLGYMFFAAGLGLYGAAMFHLFTHAFFKALLFLGSGAVIHGVHDEQDMRKMGGLFRMMPMTWLMMIIGTLALTGVGFSFGALGLFLPDLGFAGFFSKDAIIEGAFMAGREGVFFGIPAFWIGTVAALLTSFYSWRLIFMTFHGTYRGPKDVYDHAHDPKWPMALPLVVLAVGAVLAGGLYKSSFIGDHSGHFWGEALAAGAHGPAVAGEDTHAVAADSHAEPAAGDHAVAAADDHAVAADEHAAEGDHGGGHHPPVWVLLSPFFATLIGFLGAIWFYLINEGMGARIAARGGPLHSFLYNKWYVDEIYHFVFVRGAKGLGDLFWKIGDVRIIDGFGPNGVAGSTLAAARRLAKAQSGYLYHYAFVMLIGVLGLLLWAQFGAGGQ
ncbi:NADH-quinone oxidoreductase subunit L [Maricaulis virginensis]|uniref:NADH:ubiquinone oxidoreductase subunit L n=1 Tax=Maricaulis virginensis TaxID=144022 RepID=A0A9W6MNY1_9PROT|nr:NADH-quinone oxidoreductase subunit L [Maricaulis virginensis]GLK52379.1 NADH:ubiquinone oxidoreductase subunit L [Maricaulis virginensis]